MPQTPPLAIVNEQLGLDRTKAAELGTGAHMLMAGCHQENSTSAPTKASNLHLILKYA